MIDLLAYQKCVRCGRARYLHWNLRCHRLGIAQQTFVAPKPVAS